MTDPSSSSFRGSSPDIQPGSIKDVETSHVELRSPTVLQQKPNSSTLKISVEDLLLRLAHRDPSATHDIKCWLKDMEEKSDAAHNSYMLTCARLLRSLDSANAEDKDVVSCAKTTIKTALHDAVQNTAAAGFTSIEDAPIVMRSMLYSIRDLSLRGSADPSLRSGIHMEVFDSLEYNFYRAPFKGNACKALASQLSHLEDVLVQRAAQPGIEGPQFHSRSLALIQSTGFGKSRTMRELGHYMVPDAMGQLQTFFVFSFYLRPRSGKHASGYPPGDHSLYDWLNGPLMAYEDLQSIPVDLQEPFLLNSLELKVTTWLKHFFVAARETFLKLSNQYKEKSKHEIWHLMSDPIHQESEEARARLIEFVVESCRKDYNSIQEDLFGQQQDKCELILSRLRLQAGICEKAMAASRAKLSTALGHGAWLVLALDEASQFAPHQVAEDGAVVALAAVRRSFCSDPSSEKSWLLLSDTNEALATLAPPAKKSGSARLHKGDAVLFSPFIEFPSNLAFVDQQEALNKLVYKLSPLQASSRAVLSRFGRPLWEAYMKPSEETTIEDEDDSVESIIDPLGGHINFRCVLSGRFILSKLLSPSIKEGKWVLHEDAYMALLMQRVHVLVLRTNRDASRSTFDLTSFQKRQVSNHLAMITSIKRDSQEIQIIIPSEPIVSQMATSVMRKANTRVDNHWAEAWQTLCQIVRQGLPIEVGFLGEISAQALLMMSLDFAKRSPLVPEAERSTNIRHGTASFVKVWDFMESLFKIEIGENDQASPDWEKLRQACSRSWINATRFVQSRKKTINEERAGISAFTRADLVQGWLRHEALVLPAGTADWDLVIPTYSGDLSSCLNHDLFSFVAVQVKLRRSGQATCAKEPRVTVSTLSPCPEENTGSHPSDRAPLGCLPIVLWLELGQRTTKVEPLVPVFESELTDRGLASHRRLPSNTNEYCRIQSSTFVWEDFPVLDRIFSKNDRVFPLLDEDEYEPPEGKCQEVKLLRRQIDLDDFLGLQPDWASTYDRVGG